MVVHYIDEKPGTSMFPAFLMGIRFSMKLCSVETP